MVVVSIADGDIATRVAMAREEQSLPDVIYAPLKDTARFIRSGVANTDVSHSLILRLGAHTFASSALALAETENGDYGAVPVDGWTQLLVYRKDIFDRNGLRPPRSYSDIRRAIQVLHNPPLLYGFIAATDPNQAYMTQVFEHFALANGVDIIDNAGMIVVDTPEMRETLEFYSDLARVSPPGNLYWQQSRELYLAGRAAMIVWHPSIMDELAGLRNSVPVTFDGDPTSRELAARTDFLTRINGPSNPAGSGYSDTRYFIITIDASEREAREFVEFSMEDAYSQIFSVAPEEKFPARRGDRDDPRRFIDEWTSLEMGVDRKAKLAELYSPEAIDNVAEGLNSGSRWGYSKGYGDIITGDSNISIFAESIRRYIDGDIDIDEALRILQAELEAVSLDSR